MECGKAPCGVIRKAKKKQVKDELDRIKQAEKKKRRLEKALATSAAIISELEKKKQKKKEEQQRLDEEGAAIAEAVALQVLLGEEDSDQVMMEKDDEFNHWERCANNFDFFVGDGGARTTAAIVPQCRGQQIASSQNEEMGRVYGHGQLNGYGYGFGAPYLDEGGWEAMEISGAALIAAQAVSSLRIADDEDINAYVLDRMVRG